MPLSSESASTDSALNYNTAVVIGLLKTTSRLVYLFSFLIIHGVAGPVWISGVADNLFSYNKLASIS